MIRVVLDTNVLVSSLIKTGKPRDLLSHIFAGDLRLIISGQMLQEFASVVARPKIMRYLDKRSLSSFQAIIMRHSEMVVIHEQLKIAEDSDDNVVIETALAGNAGYIISGDHHLLNLTEFKNIKIVSVDRMLGILES